MPLNGKMYPLIYPGKSNVFFASLCLYESGNSQRVVKGLVFESWNGSWGETTRKGFLKLGAKTAEIEVLEITRLRLEIQSSRNLH